MYILKLWGTWYLKCSVRTGWGKRTTYKVNPCSLYHRNFVTHSFILDLYYIHITFTLHSYYFHITFILRLYCIYITFILHLYCIYITLVHLKYILELMPSFSLFFLFSFSLRLSLFYISCFPMPIYDWLGNLTMFSSQFHNILYKSILLNISLFLKYYFFSLLQWDI